VKNFAQAMELSQNVEDEGALKRELASMGVEGMPGIEGVSAATPADD
jgi:DNA-directed RNA polymerase subunit B"